MLEKIFLQILNMSFTASFAIIFVLFARLVLKRLPKALSYTLWAVVLFRLICPFSFESVFSLLPAKTNPISKDIIYAPFPAIDTGISAINHAVNSSLPAATPASSINPLQIWVFIGSMVWLLGIAVLLFYSIVSLLKLQNRLKNAIYKRDNIYLTEHLETPFVMGIIRPKIYLPISLKGEEKRYILLHEQMHIKRFDHVVKILSFFVLCLHWFNPLVWLAFFISGRDMEMSCDEAVIKQLGNDVKKDYSTSLLTLATGRHIIGGTPLAFGEGDTKERIKNVLSYKKPTFWLISVAAVAVFLMIVGLISNPKDMSRDSTDVNAVILDIDKNTQTMTVEGIDKNSMIGDRCIVTWEKDALITDSTSNNPTQLTIDDFAVGDSVVLSIFEVQESYPTRTIASTIQLQSNDATAEYSFAMLDKNGELSWTTRPNKQLAQDILMNVLVKSAAWEGVDISTLDEYFLIRETLPKTHEVHDYYAYRLPDGTEVLQVGTNGRYSVLSEELYESLAKHVISPNTNDNTQLNNDTDYSRGLNAEELAQTEAVVRNYFTVDAPYYEGVVSIELMPNDSVLYQNQGIESKYKVSNIIIYKVLTGRDKKDHKPERTASVARISKDATWDLVNQGY